MAKQEKSSNRGKGMSKTFLLNKVEELEFKNNLLERRLDENTAIFNKLDFLVLEKITIFNAVKKVNLIKNILSNG